MTHSSSKLRERKLRLSGLALIAIFSVSSHQLAAQDSSDEEVFSLESDEPAFGSDDFTEDPVESELTQELPEESLQEATIEVPAEGPASISEIIDDRAESFTTIDEREQTTGASTSEKLVCKPETVWGVPYLERRSTIGWTIGLGMNFFTPDLYTPNFSLNESFSDYYGSEVTPMYNLEVGARLQGSFGAVGLNTSFGYYRKQADIGTTLSVMAPQIDVTYYLDMLFSEPYIVPYAGGGATILFYDEKFESNSFTGQTVPYTYYRVGFLFQLDRLDKDADLESYKMGIENTYIFLEARSYMDPGDPNVDLSTGPEIGAGLKFEF
ncbi:MAG: hypothetical protein COT74_04080 [Bdellovibrionales bacterium CG10_big_fil_rev_8_21_14_0_10_45_34]|nr:MAG: hypothetical protein COT74_04080 [Bdellovibrionales bacterium CG10_big_fil_rev_8_21_14_0_10_45_34]